MSHDEGLAADRRGGLPQGLPWGRVLLSLMLLAMLALSSIGLGDDFARQRTDQAFERSLVTFAVARGINAAVSVVQGTELAVEPGGVGVVLAPGEVFDPVNDLIERFSWVMLASSASLGIQKVLLDASATPLMRGVVAITVGIGLVLLWIVRHGGSAWRVWLWRMIGMALFLRFAVLMVALASDGVYQGLLEARYHQSMAALQSTEATVKAQTPEPNLPSSEDVGLAERIGHWWKQRQSQWNVSERIDAMRAALSGAVHDLIQLLVVFILQTMVLPLLFLWIAWRLFTHTAALVLSSVTTKVNEHG